MSSISLEGSPSTLTPGYNPVVFYFLSSNYAKPGYRYYVEIVNCLTSTIIATYRFAPAIGTHLGVVDITRILKNFLSYDTTTFNIQTVPNSWFNYIINVYDEYSKDFLFSDITNPSGNLTALYESSGYYSSFKVGDQITIDQNDHGLLNPSVQGIHTIVAPTNTSVDPTTIYIDVPYDQINHSINGNLIYADNRKTRNLSPDFTTGKRVVFNGSVPFVDFPLWYDGDWTIGITTYPYFLTSMPRNGFNIYETQDIRLNYANMYNSDAYNIYFYNSNGDDFLLTNNTVSGEPIIGASVGPQTSLTLISGTFPLVKPDTEWYCVMVVDSLINQISEEICFNIKRECRIQNFEIMFMDRLGSMNSFSFELRGDVTNNNTKSTFKQLVGGYDGYNGYNYNTSDMGEQTFNVDFYQTQTLNTSWLTDEESLYFQELVTSPVTLLKNDNGDYVNVIVTDTQMVEKRQIDKHLVRYTISVKFSNNQNINI